MVLIMLVISSVNMFTNALDKKSNKDEEVLQQINIKQGINSIKKLEERTVSQSQEEIDSVQNNQNSMVESNTNENNEEEIDYIEKFSDSVILGDSRAETIILFKTLDNSEVVAYKGRNVITAQREGDIDKAINLAPKNIFLTYGLNDVELFDNSSIFINQYKNIIKKIQAELPDANIYVNSIFRVGQNVADNIPAYKKIPEYNNELLNMCNELNVNYIDGDYIVSDEFFEVDQIHFIVAFNKIWLNLFIEKANL